MHARCELSRRALQIVTAAAFMAQYFNFTHLVLIVYNLDIVFQKRTLYAVIALNGLLHAPVHFSIFLLFMFFPSAGVAVLHVHHQGWQTSLCMWHLPDKDLLAVYMSF